MKKILSAVAAFALAVALISCGGNSDEFDGKVDTVLTIGAPSVTAKAYPGVNYIQWSVVPSADKYEIYRIGDGEANGTQISTTAKYEYADVASTSNVIADGKTYKYVVVAVPANAKNDVQGNAIPTRAIYMKANKGEASVKAYVPAAGTEITAFTDSYTKSFLKKYADEKALSKAGAKVTFVNDILGGGDLYATFPATAGFNFGVKFINKTQPDFIKVSNQATGSGVYLEDYTGNYKEPTLSAGEYDAYVTVSSVCGFYPTTVTYSLGTYTIPELKVKPATTVTAASATGSRFTAEKKAYIEWTPAVLANGTVAPTTNYKVYRTEGTLDDGKTLVAVTATVNSKKKYSNTDNNNIDTVVTDNAVANGSVDTITTVYFIEDEVPAAGKYTYFVVNTDGTEFEKIDSKAYGSVTVGPYALNTTAAPTFDADSVAISKDKDNLYNQIKIKAYKGKRNGNYVVTQKLALSYVILDTTRPTEPTANYTSYNRYLDKDFTTIDITKNNDVTDESFISYDVTKAANGTYLFKLTATEDGYAPQSSYKLVFVTGASVDVSKIKLQRVGPVTTSAPTENSKLLVWDEKENADTLSNFKYNIVSVKEVKNNAPYTDYVEVTSTVKELKLTVEQVKNDDWINADKVYVKSSVATYAANGDNGKTGDDLRYITHPYALVDDVKSDKNADGKTTTVTWSVQKLLANDANSYAYSDNNGNPGQVVINFHN